MKLILVTILLFLVGCGEVQPIKFDADQLRYVGTWYFANITETDTLTDIEKMYLKVAKDGKAEYSRCYMRKERKDQSDAYSISKSWLSMRDVVVTEITNSTISLQFNLWIFKLGKDLEISTPPHEIDGNWFLSVEDAQLSKIELYDVSSWSCPNIDDL